MSFITRIAAIAALAFAVAGAAAQTHSEVLKIAFIDPTGGPAADIGLTSVSSTPTSCQMKRPA